MLPRAIKDKQEQEHRDILTLVKNNKFGNADFFQSLGANPDELARVEKACKRAFVFYQDRCINHLKIKHLNEMLDLKPEKYTMPAQADAALVARMKLDIKEVVGSQFCQVCQVTTHNTDKCHVLKDVDAAFKPFKAKHARWGMAKGLVGKKRNHKVFMEAQVGKAVFMNAYKAQKKDDASAVPHAGDKKVVEDYTDIEDDVMR